MLIQRLRRRTRGVGAYIIVLLLALPLALVGFNWFGSSGRNVVVATVNGEALHLSELDRYAYQERRRILAAQGDAADPDAISDVSLRRSALALLLSRKALLQRARSFGFRLSTDRVNDHLRSQPEFQEAGRFSRQRYEWLLQQSSYTPSWFREVQHDSLLIAQLSSVGNLSEFTTEHELSDLLAVATERRAVRYMVLSPEVARAHIELDEGELREAFEADRESYRLPAMVMVDYVELARQAFYPHVAEQQVRRYYDQEVAMLRARVYAAHILIEGDMAGDGTDAVALRERMATLRERLAAGEDFAELAAEYSDDLLSAEDGGELGEITPGELPEPLDAALAALAPGEVASEPIRTEAGWHFLRRIEPEVPDYAERGGQIRERLQQLNSDATYRQAQERLGELSFNAPDLATVAEAMAIELSRSGWFSRDGEHGDGAEGIAAQVKIRAAAFSAEVLDKAENSQLLEIGDGGDERTVVLRIAENEPSRLLTFAEAQAELRADVVAERVAQWLRDSAHSAVQRLRGEPELTVGELARSGGYEWYARPSLTRSGDHETPNEVVRAAFRLPPPSTGTKSVGTASLPGGAQAVLSLLSRRVLAPELLSPRQRDDWRENVRRQFGASQERSYRRYVFLSAQVE